ncbi:MAG: TrbI/VirB10 family protein [Rhodopila sp.]
MKLPSITGKFEAPKPWQIGIGIGAAVLLVLVGPALKDALIAKKKEQRTAQIVRAGQAGEPWHPVEFPEQKPAPTPMPQPPALLRPLAAPVVYQPMPQPQVAPASSQNLAASKPTATAKEENPEETAINSPIRLGAGQGNGGNGGRTTEAAAHQRVAAEEGGGGETALAGLLKPTELPGYRATVMAKPWATIESGRMIACHNVTSMTSSLPGLVKAQVTYDVWSADDTTMLIDHDSTITGEIAHGLAAGQDRLFVLWRKITTPKPNLVRITLNSPAADEMGEAGLTGDVDHHTWQKIKGAVLLSTIDTVLSGLSAGLQQLIAGNNGNNNNNTFQGLNFYQFQGQGSNVASQVLQSQMNIPDTMHINQARPCTIMIAGDLVFDDIYATRRKLVR